MAWCQPDDKPLYETMVVSLLTRICVNRPQWVKIFNISLKLCTRFALWHDDVIKWKHFPRYWPFVRGIHRWPVNSQHKGQWRGAMIFDLRLNERLSKQSWSRWFETQSRPLRRHSNVSILWLYSNNFTYILQGYIFHGYQAISCRASSWRI